ncbi:hypothetical protein J6590_037332 [Homalodisca vitripennis]|nr:hypothetical protein J6590_037332 [Homalodisca vitripennis]
MDACQGPSSGYGSQPELSGAHASPADSTLPPVLRAVSRATDTPHYRARYKEAVAKIVAHS